MDDWKLTAQAIVKLKKERNMLVYSYRVFNLFFNDYTILSCCMKVSGLQT